MGAIPFEGFAIAQSLDKLLVSLQGIDYYL